MTASVNRKPVSDSCPDFPDVLRTYGRHVNEPYVHFLARLGLAVEFTEASQASVVDAEGRHYIDCIGGYGNLNLGHHHPGVIDAVISELRSNRPFNWPFISGTHARLAAELARICPGNLECSLIVNSGSEAVDSALKLVRLATRKSEIICARGGWHGFTFGALSISEPDLCRTFQPLLPGITAVPYGDAAAIESAISEQTGAVILEPIQSESGAVVPPPSYLSAVEEICRRKNVVLIFDEIKTGIAKTGRMFACEHDGAVPDMLLLGKSLGGGAMPIGVVVARRDLWSKFGLSFPMSSSSAAGNAPACAAALATLQAVESEDLCAQAAQKGASLATSLELLVKQFPDIIRGFSGRGLLLALHAANLKVATEIVKNCISRGVLVMTAFCNRTRILIEPPICISNEQVSKVSAVLADAVAHVSSGNTFRD